MDAPLRRLLPSFETQKPSLTTTTPSAGQQQVTKARRKAGVTVACEPCRKKKLRCDGGRPHCGRCRQVNQSCEYEVDTGDLTRQSARKAKMASLVEENTQLWELLHVLQQKSDTEAFEILARIRASQNPLSVLRSIKEADLLLSSVHNAAAGDKRLQALETQGLESPIVVPAHPWTAIAGDGLVSELVSSYFKWDDPFYYPFIDRETFVLEMRRADVSGAKYCSRFLVNVMCAARCFTSELARSYLAISGINLGDQFFKEAKKHLDAECGRPSLPTVQGLMLLFTVSAFKGMDRAGLVYRYSACEMIKRRQLEKKLARLVEREPGNYDEQRTLLRAIWGLYCFEAITAWVYLQPPLIPVPTIKADFSDDRPLLQASTTGNTDLLGRPFTESSIQPPMVPGTFRALCQVCIMLDKVMRYNALSDIEIGSTQDKETRKRLWTDLWTYKAALPAHLLPEHNTTHQTCYLSVLFDVVAIRILHPLHPSTLLDFGLQDETAKDMMLRCCKNSTSAMERLVAKGLPREYSCMFCCANYSSSFILTSFLDDPRTHDTFATNVALLRYTAQRFAMARFILQGLQAMEWALKLEIPHNARPYFDGLGGGKEDLADVPVAFVLPQQDQIRALMGEDDEDADDIGGQLGVLLSKWSALSVS